MYVHHERYNYPTTAFHWGQRPMLWNSSSRNSMRCCGGGCSSMGCSLKWSIPWDIPKWFSGISHWEISFWLHNSSSTAQDWVRRDLQQDSVEVFQEALTASSVETPPELPKFLHWICLNIAWHSLGKLQTPQESCLPTGSTRIYGLIVIFFII